MTVRQDLQQRIDKLTPTFNSFTIGGVRIVAALLWIANVHWKVPPDFGKRGGGGLYKYTASGAQNAPFAPFRWLLRELVVPNFQLFGWFTLLSEIAIAALLLIGYRTRLVGLIGAAMAVPIGLSVIYYPKGDEWAWSYILMIGLHLLLAAVGAGDHLGVDGALKGSRERASRALQIMGIASAVVGVMGLFVARSVGFASSKLALLGSDAGFVADGKLTRRWELKLLFFNPLWALLTIVFAALLVAGSRKAAVAWAGAAGFGVIALVGLLMKTFDYARDDGQVQKISSGSNVAFWGGLALGGALLARRSNAVTTVSAEPAVE